LSSLPPLEIQALVKILDDLDYYQILHLEPGATQSAIKKAYFASSRTFHPDANRHLEGELRDSCMRISKRITEAYCVLRDPRRRKSYDSHLESESAAKRIQLAEAMASHVKKESEARQGKTAQGRQFYQRAQQCLARGDTTGAANNLRMALTFEPSNDFFKQQLSAVKKL
jgi:DnaJ-class molecular chaperone